MAGNPGHQYRTLEAWKIAQATLPDSLRRRARPFVRGYSPRRPTGSPRQRPAAVGPLLPR